MTVYDDSSYTPEDPSMAGLPIAKPDEIGFILNRLQRAYDLLDSWVRTDKVPAAALCVGRKGKMLPLRLVGRQRPEAAAPALRKDALFLVASITKPVTVTAAMILVERGQLALEDKVASYVPRFGIRGKKDVEIRHLMTHTSGLPDMLPNNDKLRAAHKPLSAFIEDVCRLPILFPPGTRVNYQSMGTAMLAEVVHQVSGVALHEFLRKEVFAPLGMPDTSLGWQKEKKDRIAVVRVPADQEKTDWHWNTPYWLGFGAPWGGMVTSPADFARFCQMMLNGGSLGDVRILSPASVRAMTTNQLGFMPQVPKVERRCRPWGLGWRLQCPASTDNFGDLVGFRAFGHWGATGTLCWMDPDSGTFFILFTTEPIADSGRFHSRLSNAVLAALG
jgi:CubicO group peptidase (beta-lactamase class C family)